MVDFTSRQLRAFLLVAQHQNFTRAAEPLFITPSGLSVLIRELEHQLGFRRFDRTTRHVAPTAHGSQLLAVTQQSLEQLDMAMSRIAVAAHGRGDTLCVARAAPCRQHLSRRHSRLPDPPADRAHSVGRYRSGPHRGTHPGGQPRRRFRVLQECARHLSHASLPVSADGHPSRERRLATPQLHNLVRLKGERLILPPRPGWVRHVIDQQLLRAGVNPQAAMELAAPRDADRDGGGWRRSQIGRAHV